MLDLELAGTDVAGTDYDQLRVTGTITVSNALPGDYSVIRFTDFGGFEAGHGDVFQVIADGSGNARHTFDKFDLSQTVTAAGDRVLFDHSTGRAYGTGLLTTQNFSHYARNRNQSQIGRALWMEAVDYDKSGTAGELSLEFIASAYDPVAAAAKSGLKAWILTRHVDVIDPLDPRDLWVGENPTDLGAAVIQMLTAASGAEGLDSLSPEAYSGFGEIAVRLNRNFAQLGTTGRRSGDENKWGFNLGYSGEQVTSDSTSDYTSHKSSSDTVYLTADLALSSKAHLNISAGLDDGRVMARDFSGDTNTAVFGLGLSLTPESKFARFDIGASVSSTNFDAVRQGSYMSQDNQDAYAVAARVTFLPKEPSFNAVTKANQPAPSKLSLIPYVGVSYASTDVDAFSEADVVGSAQLNVDAFKRRSLVGELGLNAEYEIGESTTLTGIFAYEHEFHDGGHTDMRAEFADLGVDDTDFAIRTDGYGTSIFRLGIGIRQKLGAKASFGLGYDALLGSGISSGQHIKADVSFRF
ncbi:MAG: autotransporter outer membrane beta-barrel domain-containing protein [Opitutales bacterium]